MTLAVASPPGSAPRGTGCVGPRSKPGLSRLQRLSADAGFAEIRSQRILGGEREVLRGPLAPRASVPREVWRPWDSLPEGLGAWERPRRARDPGLQRAQGAGTWNRVADQGSLVATRSGRQNGGKALAIPGCGGATSPRVPDKLDRNRKLRD